MQNAAKVGSRNSQHHRCIGRLISFELCEPSDGFLANNFIP